MFESTTIAEALKKIATNHYVLPAFQREFVWSKENPQQIEMLFDSILQGYPIGSLLIWKLSDEAKRTQTYYQFRTEIWAKRDNHNPVCPNIVAIDNASAILDGQQRLTAMNIALTGKYRQIRRGLGTAIAANYYDTFLYLNLDANLTEQDESNQKYDFRFLSKENYENLTPNEQKYWFRVSHIYNDYNTKEKIEKYINERNLGNQANEILIRLYEAIFVDKNINYFLESDADLNKALNIFIRANNGGETLDISDLILAIIIAKCEDSQRMRPELYDFPDFIKRQQDIAAAEFKITKQFALKTFLCLYFNISVTDIKFKVENFTPDKVELLENNWTNIKEAILVTFKLVKRFGHTNQTLTSANALIPIIYYIFRKGIVNNFDTAIGYENDRQIIRQYLNMVLIKGTFGNEADATLTLVIRTVGAKIFENSKNLFPLEAIKHTLSGTSKRLTMTEEEIDNEILNVQYNDRYAFPILALLYPHLNFDNILHKDHLHPSSYFKPTHKETAAARTERLLRDGIRNDDIQFVMDRDHYNSILNLQLLTEQENSQKSSKLLRDWVDKNGIDCKTQLIPILDNNDTSVLEIKRFRLFINMRRQIITEKLLEIFNSAPSQQ